MYVLFLFNRGVPQTFKGFILWHVHSADKAHGHNHAAPAQVN